MHHHQQQQQQQQQQPDSAADTSQRKMAHPAMLPRRGSGSGGSSSNNNTTTTSGDGNNVVPALGGTVGAPSSGGGQEDYPPPLLAQPPLLPPPAAAAAAAAAASPSLLGPQPQPPPLAPPPQSLTLLSQQQQQQQPPPPPLGQAGAQMKKKSGFQITSVTPAQISASLSSNNSIAEDTESYDDLDESHTEDLSSSEILDVSLSRATDLGEPERSSSEETLNNFQEAESPGAVSPNQPRLPQQQQKQQQHPPQQQSVVINGSIHGHHFHHHHHHHHHGHHHGAHSGMGGPAAPGGPPSSPSLRKLSAAGSSEGVVTAALPVSAASSAGPPAASVVSHFRPAGTPGVTSASGGTTSTFSSSVGSGSPSVASSVPSHVNKNLSNVPSTGSTAALSGASGNASATILSGVSNGMGPSSSAVSNAGNTASLSASHLQPATSTSRFRVVKLDSSSEPFKKGRWTCTEFYDKDNPVSLVEGVASNKVVDTLRQNPLEVTSEKESTSGSSVSSNVSTLSHYTESVGSGEMGASTVAQQQAFQGAGGAQLMDVSGASSQAVAAPSIPHSISQSQLAQGPLHPQDANYPQQKPGVQPPMQAVPSPVTIAGQPSTVPAGASQQQLPYTQPMPPVQAVPVVPQQLPYGQGQAQHPAPPPPPQQMPMQMAPGHVQAVNQSSVTGPVPDYMQQQQQMLQTPASSMQSGPTVVPVAQGASMQPSLQAHLPVASSQPVAHAQALVQTVGANTQMMNVGQQGNVPPAVQPQQPPPAPSQIAPSVMAQSAGPSPPPSQVAPPVPAGIIHPGQQGSAPSVPQPLVMAPQSTLLSMQAAESLVQGMAGQQMPPVSPVPPVSAVPAQCHSAANVPPTSMSLAQPSSVQNGNLAQNVSQPSLISTGISLPAGQSVPQQIPLNSAQFSAQSLAQSIATREDARRSTEPILVGLPQPTSGESGVGASSAISDGGSSMAASLFPLKVLPLTSQLVDGEDESCFF